MFYMHLLVNKRGPLAKIWLAAHWEKKLTKAHIFECNLETTIEKIISPKFTIALRTSGHLLLGVVRIYHRKAKYLLADCSEALTKMKTAFRPGLVDLPEETFEAAYQSITLPEEFHDFETPLPDLNAIDVAEHFTLNQSRAEDITLTEDYESNILLCDRNFDEEPDALRKQSFFDGSIFPSSNSLVADHNSASVNGDKSALHEDSYCFEHDCFGDEEDAADMIEILLRDEQNGLDRDILDMEEERPLSHDLPENSTAIESNCADTTIKKVSRLTNETILLLKEEGFVLEPVDDTAVTQRKKNKRKRKLLVDVVKELSCNAIYNQLNNCTDILAALDLAPPTKKTMMWKKSGGVDKLLSHATQPVVHAELQMLFAKCFKSPGFRMRRNGIQRESEMGEARKEQDTTEMLVVEEPSYLQESAHSETERKIRNDSFMLTSQNNRNETDDNCGETIQDGMAFSESCSLANNSLGREAETRQAELTDELTRNGKDSEEIRWSRRTLQLLKTLQHLKRLGVRSFSLRELCRKNNRKEAAAKFYIFLVLKKQSVLELSQSAPFADVTATLGPMFNAH
ncbi:double-strand-break repair protein rad21-like protein 1 [Pelecanus crispus]|uniref:double-strand-break repair protein rad21-like protein 1 n=1 Tax=Pelecanus crispus TaxID=36300 RepID=UPI000511B879|nr:PREDICTED: double-strand-break repair protein rad21-like protein 1 [Pelecanus crispus]